MAKTKASVLRKIEHRKKQNKKEESKEEEDDGEKSDSENDRDDQDSGIPDLIKGTTWPTDTSIEIVVKYNPAKEIRSVKKEFYPLLYHMTRADSRQMAVCICRLKSLLSHVRTRCERNQKIREKPKISETEMKNLGIDVAESSSKHSPKKLRRASASSSNMDSAITDLTEAKTELLKVLARVTLQRREYAKLLVWMQKLKLCGKEGSGRWGEVYVKDTVVESTSDNDNDEFKTSQKEKSTKNCGRMTRVNTCDRPSGHLNRNCSRTQRKLSQKISKIEAGNSKQKQSTTSQSIKLNKFKLKGKTLCMKDSKDKDKVELKPDLQNELSNCTVPLVDVVSVLDTRIEQKNKAKQSKTTGVKRSQRVQRRHHETENNDNNIAFKRRGISQAKTPLPVDVYKMYKICEGDNMSVPPAFVEIANVEDGTSVPYSASFNKLDVSYEDRFVKKEDEVLKSQFPDELADEKDMDTDLLSGEKDVDTDLLSGEKDMDTGTSLHQGVKDEQLRETTSLQKFTTNNLLNQWSEKDESSSSELGSSGGLKPCGSPPMEEVYPISDSLRTVGYSMESSNPSTSPDKQVISKIKSECREKLYKPGELFDGVTLNFKRLSPEVGVSMLSGGNEPTSSTDEKLKEEKMDYIIVKSTDCITLDDDDDDDDSTCRSKTAEIDSQKEADPIIVIDD